LPNFPCFGPHPRREQVERLVGSSHHNLVSRHNLGAASDAIADLLVVHRRVGPASGGAAGSVPAPPVQCYG